MHVRALLGTVLLVAAAPAQTFIVDANNGPGTNFLDIASAVPAVPDGATLLVRAGSYVGFSITAKGLAIRGDPNVVVTGSVSVRNTARQQTVELRGLGWTAAPSSTTSMLILDSCAGLLLLDSLTVPGVLNCAPPGLHCLRGPAVAATSCQQILLHWCSIAGNVGLQSSNAVIDGCTLYGEDGVLAYNGGQYEVANPARTALSLGASTVQSADSFVYGGPSTNLGHGLVFLGAPGVDMSGANLRLLSGQVTEGSVFPAPRVPAITAVSTDVLRADPSVVINGVVQGTTVITVGMPSLSVIDGTVGGSVGASATAPSGDLIILVLAFPGPVRQLPGITDAFWLDPTVYSFEAFGIPPVGQSLNGSAAVPNLPQLQGIRVAWQAVSSSAVTGALQASNPGISTVR